jgi:pleiotropic regulator 1
LKVSFTGHINTVRGLCIDPKNAYMYSCGEDKKVLCWDLEYNKGIFDKNPIKTHNL